MKKSNHIFTVFSALLIGTSSIAQVKESLPGLNPVSDTANVQSKLLGTDSLSSAFVIWIKKEVRPHKHVWHSENIYILEGTGTMRVGDKNFEIKAGDYIFIPKNSVHSLKVTSQTPVKVLSVQSPEFKGDDRVFVE